ncbi:MAG: hypothetical protein PWP44_1470, partial [Thermacetogenium sp.]|nr:hypothetical protein [Thermacetogenium sp.]
MDFIHNNRTACRQNLPPQRLDQPLRRLPGIGRYLFDVIFISTIYMHSGDHHDQAGQLRSQAQRDRPGQFVILMASYRQNGGRCAGFIWVFEARSGDGHRHGPDMGAIPTADNDGNILPGKDGGADQTVPPLSHRYFQ